IAAARHECLNIFRRPDSPHHSGGVGAIRFEGEAVTRRQFLAVTPLFFSPPPLWGRIREGGAAEPHGGRALIAIRLDREMSRNFPRWEDTHWDYEKGNLNDDTKRYTVEA